MSLSQLQRPRAMGQPDEPDITGKPTGIRPVILAVCSIIQYGNYERNNPKTHRLPNQIV